MPYVRPERQEFLAHNPPETPGDLNYRLTTLCLEYIGEIVSYTALNAVIGVLECCKLEMYRRLGTAIEDSAISRNGDLDEYKEALDCVW